MDSLLAHDIYSTPRTEDVSLMENVSFRDMFFCDPVVTALTENGFHKPSPIQHKAIPLARCGFDLIVQSKSGTGKTLIFVVTALESLDLTINRVQVVVLAPTREIALQVTQVFRAVGKYMTGLVVESFIGGMPMPRDIVAAKKCQVAVGAPGRLRQLIELGHLKTDAVRLFIVDEADQLMQKSFQNDINFIYWSLSEFKQMLALSATYPSDLVAFLGKYMRSGKLVTPQTNPIPVLQGLKQFVSFTRYHPDSLARLTDKEQRLATLLSLVKFDQCIIFSNYQTRAESTCNMLRCRGWSCEWMSGKQTQEQRLYSLEELKSGRCRLLVTTNLTARGIDAKGINLVVNLDTPQDPRIYLHRMGRAGRYGSQGVVITILSRGHDFENFLRMLGRIDKKLSVKIIPSDGTYDLWSSDTDHFDEIYGIEPLETDEDAFGKEFDHLKEPNAEKMIKSKPKPRQKVQKSKNCENNLNKSNVPDMDEDNFPSIPQQQKVLNLNDYFQVENFPDKFESFDSLKNSLQKYDDNKTDVDNNSGLEDSNNIVDIECVKVDLKMPQVNRDVKDKKVENEPINAIKIIKNQVRRFSYSEIAKGKRAEFKPAQMNPQIPNGHHKKSPLKPFPTEKVSKHIEGVTISDKAIDGFSKRMYSSVVKDKNTKIATDQSNSVDKRGVKTSLNFNSGKNGPIVNNGSDNHGISCAFKNSEILNDIPKIVIKENSMKINGNHLFANSIATKGSQGVCEQKDPLKICVLENDTRIIRLNSEIKVNGTELKKNKQNEILKQNQNSGNVLHLNKPMSKAPAISSPKNKLNDDSMPISDVNITIDDSFYERQTANLSLGPSMRKRSSRGKPIEVTFEESPTSDSSDSEGEYIISGSFLDNCSFVRTSQHHLNRSSRSESNRKNSNLFTMSDWLHMYYRQSSVIYNYVKRTKEYQHAQNIMLFMKNQS